MTLLTRLMTWFIHCREVASRRADATREILALDRDEPSGVFIDGVFARPFTEDD